jgi:3',5'-cyclic AMP phosphodiesterase CpdA
MPGVTRFDRRQLLRWGAGGLLAAGLWPGALRARGADTGGDFSFAVVNDLHYNDERCGPWFEGLVRHLKARPEPIDFCLLAGDLAERGKPEQFAPVRDIFRALGRPVHVVIGNHDYRTAEDRRPFEEAFPSSLNHHFDHKGWQFVGLDTSEGTKAVVAAQPPTLQWLDATLPRLDGKRPTVVFTHFPLGPMVICRVTNAGDVLGRFKDYNLQAVFSGHYHGFTERRLGATVLTTNRCCSFFRPNHDRSKEKGYFLCRARDGRLERSFVEFALRENNRGPQTSARGPRTVLSS